MLSWTHWRLYPQWPASCSVQWPATLFPNNMHKEKAIEAKHFHAKLPPQTNLQKPVIYLFLCKYLECIKRVI